jgi:hypothetical protein
VNLNPLSLNAAYRDWWPQFPPNQLELLGGINASRCYVPRFYVAPSGGNLVQNAVAAGQYVNFVLEIPAGSFIYGFFHGAAQGYSLQITDLGLTYKFFNTPIPDSVLVSDPGECYLLPCPHPVMAPGTFFFEFWSTLTTGTSLLSLTLGVAVPVEAIYAGA